MDQKFLDTVIIGGGPAGLSAALTLGRARKHIVMIDEGHPRNAVTREAHGFLTRDKISPREFRRIAREQISDYPSVSFMEDAVVSLSGEDGHFQLETAQGRCLLSRKVLFAVGMKDRPLDIPGLAEVYGKSAFVCPYCDGWELKDKSLVIISKGTDLMHFVPLISGWSRSLVICTNGPDELSDVDREELRKHQIVIYDSPIRTIDSNQGMVRQVVLEDGTMLHCKGIFFRPDLVTGSDLPQAIGCHTSERGSVITDDFGKTNIRGIYSAGDVASQRHQAIAAAAMGAMAAAALNNELNVEAWSRNEESFHTKYM